MKKPVEVFYRYLKWAPVSLAIREVSRIQALYLIDAKYGLFKASSILDVGCGDGRWWLNILPEDLKKVHGIDISKREVELAEKLIWAKHLDVTADDFIDRLEGKRFDLVIGNCSMEHVYHIDKALKNIHSALNDNGKFVLFVPTPYWAFKGKSVTLLHRISPRLSMMFSGMLNGFFQHWHLYHYKIWESILLNFSFQRVRTYGLGNAGSEFLFRLFLPSSLVSFLSKVLTGKYLNYYLMRLIPDRLLNALSLRLVSKLDQELRSPKADDIFEYIIVCEK